VSRPLQDACRAPASFAAALALCAAGAAAQPYPHKPIRMLVISAPGGSTDILARAVGQALTDSLGQSLVVDNKAGGGGVIASETLARATPDGYTILLTHTAHSVLPSLHAKLPYDPIRDFAPVSLVALTHSVLVVPPPLPAKNVRELIELARARPGKLNYGAGTTGASAHLGAELFKMMAQVDIVHVPYKGTGAQLNALLAGEVQMSFSTVPAALPHIAAGKLRALAIGSPKRIAALPELPTVAESGLPGFDVSAWNGVLLPARAPAPIVARLHDAIAALVQRPDVKERAASQGSEMLADTPQEFAAFIRVQIDKWAKVVKSAGMRAD
jgi:tripartite-type tricarboxylate transporter receptor subunit TctC